MQRGLLLPRATEWFAGIAAGAVYRISNAMYRIFLKFLTFFERIFARVA